MFQSSPGHASDDQKLYGAEGSTVTPSNDAVASSKNELEGTTADAKAMPGSTYDP